MVFHRRSVVSKKLPAAADLVDLPCDHYDFSDVSTVTRLQNVLLIAYSSSYKIKNIYFDQVSSMLLYILGCGSLL